MTKDRIPDRKPSRTGLFCALLLLFNGLLVPTVIAQEQMKKIPLHVWGLNMGVPRIGWYALIEAFEKKYPNVEVMIGPTDRGQDLQKLLCGVVGNSPPDVFRRESQLFGDIAARGILLDLTSYIEADKDRPDGLHEEDFLPGAWRAGMFEGRMHGIVEDVNPGVLAYNKKLFREAGLDPENPPKSWAEWLDATKKLVVRDERGRVQRLGLSAFGGADDLTFYVMQCGGKVFSEDGRTCTLNSPEALKALEFMKEVYDVQGGKEACQQFVMATSSGPEELNPFGLGKIAMNVQDDWVILRVMKFSPDLELGIAPIPTPTGRNPIAVSTTNTIYMIPRNARHKNEAWAFIRFLNQPEARLAYAEAISAYARSKGQVHNYMGFSCNRRVLAAISEEYAPKEPPFSVAYNQIRGLIENLEPLPVSPVSGAMRDEMLRAMERATYNEMSCEEALTDAERRLQEQLDLYYVRESYPIFHWGKVWVILGLLIVAAVAVFHYRTRGEGARSSLQRHENRMGLVFISPWLIGLLIFTIGPIVFSIAMSFCYYDVVHPARYVGLKNYVWLFTRDPLVWKSLRNTAFMVFSLPVGMAASLGIALLLNTKVKGMSGYRTIFYLPAITPAVATAVLWYALLNPDGFINGVLNSFFGATGLADRFGIQAPAWLQDPVWSKPAMVLMGLWGAGGGMILWLAGLQGIPTQLYEAASIDGAGPFRRFWSITIPMLTPYIFFNFVVGIIGVFQIFAQALILTMGGPADSTLFYVYYLFNNAFRYFKMGYASAQAWVLFLIVLVLTLIQWRMSKKWVHYG